MIKQTSNADETPLHVVLEVSGHGTLTSLLQLLAESELSVRTQNIAQSTLTEETTVSIDLDILTEKQRETLELALEEGYYERPREADLGELADQLGISRSAVSQRIRNAELKLITSALDRYR